MRSDIKVGAGFPNYELPDQDGVSRQLSDLQGSNPMVLHPSRRGGGDPKEHRFLRHMVDAYLDFRVGRNPEGAWMLAVEQSVLFFGTVLHEIDFSFGRPV
jgi:hypothetical protein